MLADGCARLVEQALLGEEDERPLSVSSVPRRPLRLRDLGERPAHVNRSCFGDLRCEPRNRPVERVVELERTRPIAPTLQPAAVPMWQPVTRERDQLLRRHVAEHKPACGQLAERRDVVPGLDLSAQ